MEYANGNIYDGEWKDDKPNGQGKITFRNGNSQEGQWKDGIQTLGCGTKRAATDVCEVDPDQREVKKKFLDHEMKRKTLETEKAKLLGELSEIDTQIIDLHAVIHSKREYREECGKKLDVIENAINNHECTKTYGSSCTICTVSHPTPHLTRL